MELEHRNWSPQLLWYLVGLITSDGCLSGDGRHITIVSKDKSYLDKVLNSMGLNTSVKRKWRPKDQYPRNACHYIQFSDVKFHRFLIGVGLMPRKSLIISKLHIPQKYFHDFLRGEIDGDGNIRRWVHPQNGNEQWALSIVSGSEKFIDWLNKEISRVFRVKGAKYTTSCISTLRFGKMATVEILKQCYYEECLCLKRKENTAKQCINSRMGWKKSKTVF